MGPATIMHMEAWPQSAIDAQEFQALCIIHPVNDDLVPRAMNLAYGSNDSSGSAGFDYYISFLKGLRLDLSEILSTYLDLVVPGPPDFSAQDIVGFRWCRQVNELNQKCADWFLRITSRAPFVLDARDLVSFDAENSRAVVNEEISALMWYWQRYYMSFEDLFRFAMLQNVDPEYTELTSTLKRMEGVFLNLQTDYQYELAESERRKSAGEDLQRKAKWSGNIAGLIEIADNLKNLDALKHVGQSTSAHLRRMKEPLDLESLNDFNELTRLHCFGYLLHLNASAVLDALVLLRDGA